MKIIAYYLPQFHEIKENNKWWGEGFTEWTNVKNAEPLFNGHNQPIEPLNDNYYNLLEKETVEWQTNLANKHGIYGFCYYHYWFDGRKILEKPAENLLKWKDINQKFCFNWANHSWKKTWNGSNKLLIKQDYGGKNEWESHFNYLLNFFKDERYIKINNKPVFLIYSPKDVPEISERVEYYNEKCKENGFDGIYLIESFKGHKYIDYKLNKKFEPVSNLSSGIILREPSVGMSQVSLLKKIENVLKRNFKKNYLYKPLKYNYSDICKKSINYAKKIETEQDIFLGSFTNWDSTPRHSRRGYIINSTPEQFSCYLKKQKEIISQNNSIKNIVFLNAWNEWGEGMYLEPDKKNGYRYLEKINEITDD